ncbi:MAG: hypothetical protein AAF493_17880 [Pseudomonadota bacterium]
MPRRIGSCFDDIVSVRNLWRAWQDFRRGKRRRASVRRFEWDADAEVIRLHRDLIGGEYSPNAYRVMFLNAPKRRVIAAAPVADRVVHHAVHRVLAPALDNRLVDTTFACLPERGSHRAILAFQRALRRHRYVLLLDIRHYFPSIDPDILGDVMAKMIKDRRTLRLLNVIAASGTSLYRDPTVRAFAGMANGEPPLGVGLPIGNLTSQW